MGTAASVGLLAVGATYGYIYIRSEYPHAVRAMQRAILAVFAEAVEADSAVPR